MKLTTTVFLMLLLISCPLLAQEGPEVVWTNYFGTESNDGARDIEHTPDGNLVIAGYTRNTDQDDQDMFLVKLDLDGNQLFTAQYGQTGRDVANSVVACDDGGFVLAGYIDLMEGNGRDFVVVKLNSEGESVWQYLYSSPYSDGANSIAKTSDGGYIVTGYSGADWEATQYEVILVKLDADGNESWSQIYQEDLAQHGNAVIETSDGSFVILGETGTVGASNRNVYMIKTDSEGEVLWVNQFGGNGFDWGHDVVELSTGEYGVAAEADVHGTDFMNTYALRISDNGDNNWDSNYGPGPFYQYSYAIEETPDGGLLVGGVAKNRGTNNNDIFLVKYEPDGSREWYSILGDGTTDEWLMGMCRLDDGFAIAGHSNADGAGGYDMMVMKLNNSGMKVNETPSGVPRKPGLMPNYPNPFNAETKLVFNLEKRETISLSLYDLTGREVSSLLEGTFQPGSYSYHLTAANLPSGTYFCRLVTGSQVDTRRLVLLK